MNILISNDRYKDPGFISWLLNYIQFTVFNYIDPLKLIRIDLFLNNKSQFKNRSRRRLSAKEILISASLNLVVYNIENIKIEIDKNAVFYGTQIKLVSLVKFVTYGAVGVKGYPLLLDIFNEINNNMESYYLRYKVEVG